MTKKNFSQKLDMIRHFRQIRNQRIKI